MIASLRGTVAHAGLDRVVLEVGGVGLLVHTTPAAAATSRPGLELALATSLVVREDSLTLYGFPTEGEREMFETVQTVSGVGPRLALAMLSVLTAETLRQAIAASDLATLTKVPGVGRKGAERIALELRDKLAPTGAEPATPLAVTGAAREQVTEALAGLGWSAKAAGDAVEAVLAGGASPDDVSALLRAALRELGR